MTTKIFNFKTTFGLLGFFCTVLLVADLRDPHNAQGDNSLQVSRSTRPGSNRDAHGCIGSAGYVWCEPLQVCVRPWLLSKFLSKFGINLADQELMAICSTKASDTENTDTDNVTNITFDGSEDASWFYTGDADALQNTTGQCTGNTKWCATLQNCISPADYDLGSDAAFNTFCHPVY